jgi:hypothetical protein
MPEGMVPEMTKGKKEPADVVGIEYIVPILVGGVGGLLVLLFPFLMALGSNGYRDNISYFGFLTISVATEYSILIVIGSVFLGFVSACILGNRITTITGAVRAGIVTAVPTLLFLLLIERSLRYISPLYTDLWIISPLLPFFMVLSLGVLFQAVGAVCGYYWIWMHPEYSNPLHLVRWELIILKPAIVTMLVVLAIIVIPVVYSHATPTVDSKKCFMFGDAQKIERLDEETIRITQLNENSPEDCLSDMPYVNKLFIDGMDVSSQAIIEKQGLPDTIEPPEGLVYGNGSWAILTGPDISNKTHSPHFQIIKYTQGRDGSLIMLRYTVDTVV